MRTKICGMTQLDQVRSLDAMGVDFAGFIFYPQSPRYIGKFMDPALLRKYRGERINKVGVFVNEDPETVRRTIETCGLYLVQLHGDETPKYCEKMADFIGVIKAFRIREGEDILWKIKDYQDIVDFFLFDTAGAGYGGTGKKFNWEVLQDLNIGKPFFLSGGIGPDDVTALSAFSASPVSKDLFALDLNSKFETAPGIKNMDLVRPFLDQIQHLS